MSEKKQINLIIDGTQISVPEGTTVYEAAKQLGIELPVFCYQDRMPPFGACRVCLVEVEKMAKPQTSCTLVATEGMVVKTQSKLAEEGRNSILEFLLINHPLDCPICDKGGECPLQEHTLHYGPGLSRFYEEKRHFKKPIPLGRVLMLDRERCIVCARCTRFGELLAGDHALELIDRGYKTEVGTPDGGPAESKFIGNTIAICPVGALTSKVYRFRARPWDNDSTNSTCTLCPVGCSLILDSRDGEIVRTRAQENPEINDMWLCDKGWFGYEFTYHPERLQKPLMRKNGELHEVDWDEALDFVADRIQRGKPGGKLAGFGGNPLTIEENFLFQKLMREGAGVNHLDHRIGMPLHSIEDEGLPPGMTITIGEIEHLEKIFLLGIDLTEEFPVIWLRLRQAIHKGAEVIFLGHYAPEIAPYISRTILHAPGQELPIIDEHVLLSSSKKNALFVGRQYLDSSNRKTILSRLSKLCQNATLNLLEGRGNSLGARLAGMRPDLGPNGQKIERPGLNAVQVLQEAAKSGWDFLYVAGANPAKKYPKHLWITARQKTRCLVVQDLFLTETAQEADLVLPTLSFVEKEGTFLNIDYHLQRLQPGKEIPAGIYSDGEIFRNIGEKLGHTFVWEDLLIDRQQKIESSEKYDMPEYTNGLAATFSHLLFDQGVRMKHNPHVIKLVKEPRVRINLQEALKKGIKNGDIVHLSHNGATIQGKIRLDKNVADGTIVIPLGFDELPAQELGVNLLNGIILQVEHGH